MDIAMFKLVLFLVFVSSVTSELDLNDCTDPKAKCVIRAMDKMISDHVAWNNRTAWTQIMSEFFTRDMIYDSNFSPNSDLGNSTGIDEWYDREHIPYNLAFDNCTFSQLIFASEEETATTTTYAKATWRGDLATIPGSEHMREEVTIRIFDFYLMREDKIWYNWMLLDTVHLMLQVGYRVLPEPKLREGWVQAPRAMDGIPAPISRLVNPLDGPAAKLIVEEVILNDLVFGESPSRRWTEDMTWYGPVGFGLATNKSEYEQHFLGPLRSGFTAKSVDFDVISCEGSYCGAHGYLNAKHTGPWLGEQATGKLIQIRFGFHFRVNVPDRNIPEGYAMFDLPAAFHMMGIDLYGRMDQQHRIQKI